MATGDGVSLENFSSGREDKAGWHRTGWYQEKYLGNSRTRNHGGLDLSVKVDLERKCCSVEYSPAVTAQSQVALYLTGHFGCQASFEIFANQSNSCFAGHSHNGLSQELDPLDSYRESARRSPKSRRGLGCVISQSNKQLHKRRETIKSTEM